MAHKIDLDRGVTKRIVAATGRSINMYKDEPGNYYYDDGSQTTEAEARAAGFPVSMHSKQKLRRQLLAKAQADIDAKFHAELGEAMKEIDERTDMLLAQGLKPTGDMEFELDLTGKE